MANIATNEQKTPSLLECFLKRVQKIFEVYLKYSQTKSNNKHTATHLFVLGFIYTTMALYIAVHHCRVKTQKGNGKERCPQPKPP